MENQFDQNDLRRFASLLGESRRIVITCHLSPDGDALGSSLGLQRIVRHINAGAKVAVVTPDEPTRTLSFLPGFGDIVVYSRNGDRAADIIARADLIVCLDYNALNRIDLVAPHVAQSQAAKVLVDHHLDPEDFAGVRFSYPHKSSTCMLLYEIIVAMGISDKIDPMTADCLLAGMMTDTGDFSYNVQDPGIYAAIGGLIEAGADKARLTRLLFNTFSESCLRIQGFALSERMEVFGDMHAALITLTRDELNKWNYKRGDTEGLVNKPLSIPGILYTAYLREEEKYVKVSMRSLGNFPANEICSSYFGGGGHLNAAGGEFYGTMDECTALFRSLLKKNKEKYIDNNAELKKLLSEELHTKI